MENIDSIKLLCYCANVNYYHWGRGLVMKYEEFMNTIQVEIRKNLPEDFNDYEMKVERRNKVNETKDALFLLPRECEGEYSAPIVYLDEMYEEYQLGQNIESIAMKAADIMTEYAGFNPVQREDFDLQDLKDYICVNLINTKANLDYLEGICHQEFFDLSVIYRIITSCDRTGVGSFVVTPEMMQHFDLTLQEMHELALKNTDKVMGHHIHHIEDDLYIMSNTIHIYGAAAILTPEGRKKLYKRVGSDYYIIPVTVNEVLAVPDSKRDPSELLDLLYCNNRDLIEEKLYLSNSIYHYTHENDYIDKVASYEA